MSEEKGSGGLVQRPPSLNLPANTCWAVYVCVCLCTLLGIISSLRSLYRVPLSSLPRQNSAPMSL